MKYYLLLIVLFLIACSNGNNKNKNNPDKSFANQQITLCKDNLELQKKNPVYSKYLYNSGNIGFWGLDSAQLPVFNFTAPLPLYTITTTDSIVKDNSTDPWFLMGNNHLTLFNHASGEYELMTLERSIARLNYGGKPNSGDNFAILEIKKSNSKKEYQLTGKESKIANDSRTIKAFGCGFAAYQYMPEDGITVERILSTVPSQVIKDGCSAFLINVEIRNTTNKDIEIKYSEGLTARYDFTFRHNYPGLNYRAIYPLSASENKTNKMLIAEFHPTAKTELVFGEKNEHCIAESFPPQVRLQILANNGEINSQQIDSFAVKLSGSLVETIRANSKIRISYVIGYVNYGDNNYWNACVDKLKTGKNQSIPFRKQWDSLIPDFEKEKDKNLQAEMKWHTGVLYAMTNWSEFYHDLYVPQGNLYEYALGVGATTSDNLMQTLPFSYMNPEYAKSLLRYCLKQITFRGTVNGGNEGSCRIPQAPWIKSHGNLYTLMALTEYFEQNPDADFLNEEIQYWGDNSEFKSSVLDRIKRSFLYLRDEIYVGKHGLIRTLLSDWNDCFYFYFKDENFFEMFGKSESFSNTAMAVQYLGKLSTALEKIKDNPKIKKHQDDLIKLISAMRDYRKELNEKLNPYFSNIGFLPRAYLGSGKLLGKDTMYLEPQAFALGIEDLPIEKRKQLWNEVKKRILQSEKLGARQGEFPFVAKEGGSSENGGFWYSLNGPLLNGLIDIDKEQAKDLFNRMTLNHHAQQFPNYWVGMWSGPDTYDSSISRTEGLVRWWGAQFPVYCAHAHSWVLWNYYKMNK